METAVHFNDHEMVDCFVRNPSEETFALVFRTLAPQLLCYFRARGCELPMAEDLTQEVMLTVYRKVATLRNEDLFRPWLFRIAKNTLLQSIRHQGRQVETLELDSHHGDSAARDQDPFHELQFGEWMRWLSAAERELLLLRYVEGLEYHEIAALLKMPMGTVQWRVHQVKKKLAAHFGPAAI